MFDKQSYVSLFEQSEKRLANSGPDWVHAIRKRAIAKFETLGFPTLKNEDWRFTRVRPLLQHDFKLVSAYKTNGVGASDLNDVCLPDTGLYRMVFVAVSLSG